MLNDIAGFYAAPDEATFKAKTSQLEQRFARLEARVAAAPWFDGEHFSLVDAVFGPVFRYFDVFDDIADFGILAGKPKLARWRQALAARPSVRAAVSADYPALLRDFLDRRNSWLSGCRPAPPRDFAIVADEAKRDPGVCCGPGLRCAPSGLQANTLRR